MGKRRRSYTPRIRNPGWSLDKSCGEGSGKLEALEQLVAEEIARLGGIMEKAPDAPEESQVRREFEDLLRGCHYTFRGGQLVIWAKDPARAARLRLDTDRISEAWLRLAGVLERPAIVVRMEPGPST